MNQRTAGEVLPCLVVGGKLAGLGSEWPDTRPSIPAASSHARTRATVGSPMYWTAPSPRVLGLEIGHLERGGFGDSEEAVGHDGEKLGVPEPPDGSVTTFDHRGRLLLCYHNHWNSTYHGLARISHTKRAASASGGC